ncbi:hypothetical protein SASPL_149079 [Salvia splendens]|uniref:Terpene synthase N-terminal domain-containing protein n=1 Tax=Salvia splendens TaxID=180675 RepID=A0A8X8WB28_SALSN|nr:hypothetical protein SASPL_149079 [Salvia splendens]
MREHFPRHPFLKSPATAACKSSVNAVCSLAMPTDMMMGKIKDNCSRQRKAVAAIQPVADIASSLCIVDTLQRLGVDRYFQSDIDEILEEPYR